jgi:hypothetical protein
MLQSPAPDAMTIQARVTGPELGQPMHKHRSAPIWLVIVGLSLALTLLLSRGSLLALIAGRPHASALWPLTLPRAPPNLRLA